MACRPLRNIAVCQNEASTKLQHSLEPGQARVAVSTRCQEQPQAPARHPLTLGVCAGMAVHPVTLVDLYSVGDSNKRHAVGKAQRCGRKRDAQGMIMWAGRYPHVNIRSRASPAAVAACNQAHQARVGDSTPLGCRPVQAEALHHNRTAGAERSELAWSNPSARPTCCLQILHLAFAP